MRKVLLKRVIAMFIIFTVAMPVSNPMTAWAATDPAQETTITRGQGTPTNPYQIWNVSQLKEVNTKGLDREYILMADIVMKTSEQWAPLGTSGNPFTGVFNGNGYAIKNLTSTTLTTYRGLFAAIKGAIVKNVTLENVIVKGTSHVGSIAGYAYGTCTISNCGSSGSVSGTANYVGGLIGYADIQKGMISNSYHSGNVSGAQGVGGLVGYQNYGTIVDSYNLSNVTANNYYTGGLVGQATNSVYARNFNMGTISGTYMVGGIVGYGTSSSITNSYNQGEVKSTGNYCGGIVGYSYSTNSSVQNCYSSGRVTASSYAGGIAGGSYAGLGISGCAAVTHLITSLTAGYAGRISATKTEVYSKNVANQDMFIKLNGISKTISSGVATLDGLNISNSTLTTNSSYWANTLGWDFNSIWTMSQVKGEFPVLRTTYKPVTQITLSENSKSVSVGDKFTLVATILPENTMNKNITWTSSNTSIASVTQSGEVTALANGQATITAKSDSGGLEAKCTVTVGTDVTGISLSSTAETLKNGESITLTATVTPNSASNKTLQWTSSNASVASVSDAGKVTALSDGQTVITVKAVSGGVEAKCTVTVSTPITGIEISSGAEKLLVGDSTKLTANVLPETTSNKNVKWRSSDSSIATVAEDGTVKAIKEGTARITVQTEDGKFEAYCTITVEPLNKKVNIAKGKKAVSESISGSNIPKNAVDGVATTRWTAKTNTSDVFLMVDFEEKVTFEEIKIVEHDDRISEFKLQYFNGSEWIDFHTGTTISDDFHISFAPITCTQVRLFVVSTKGTYGASIYEFEVLSSQTIGSIDDEEPTGPENLALNKAATASHTSGSNTAKKAVDGSKDSRWTASSNSEGATLEIDFGEETQFNQVKLYEAYDRVNGFRIQYFDGTDWVDCHKGVAIGKEYTADFVTVKGSKIRLVFDSLNGANGAAIYEVEVYHL